MPKFRGWKLLFGFLSNFGTTDTTVLFCFVRREDLFQEDLVIWSELYLVPRSMSGYRWSTVRESFRQSLQVLLVVKELALSYGWRAVEWSAKLPTNMIRSELDDEVRTFFTVTWRVNCRSR